MRDALGPGMKWCRAGLHTGPYIGLLKNPVWRGFALGPFGLFYWLKKHKV